MREEVLKGLKNAVDPASPDLLNFTKHAQPIVDAAYLVHAFLRAPKVLWEPLDEVTKERYIKSFQPYVIVLVLTTTGYSSPD